MVYQGSKAKYAKYIVPILQEAIDTGGYKTFVDGCCGGCNIIDKINTEMRIAVDIDPGLIALYQHVQKYGFDDFPEKITREDWNYRKAHPDAEPWLTGLVAYFTSYSARGFSGGFACGDGSSRDFYGERLRNFKAQFPRLQDVSFVCSDIKNLCILNSVVYIDPPYQNTKRYDYSKNFNHDDFWDFVRSLSRDNKVFVSEQVAPDDFEAIWSLDTKRNTFGSKATSATENLFVYKGD